jgi:hypothetical protein
MALSTTIVVTVLLSDVAFGAPSQTFTLDAGLTPDELDAPTNLSATLTLAQTLGVPTPVSDVVVYGPAGLRLEVRGLPTCTRQALETVGPSGCPAESRVGFGGGVGAFELAGVPVKEPYTLDFFLAPREHGHLAMLIYASALNPIGLQLVLSAKEVRGPSPYGFGLAVAVPKLPTIPGAANASVETGYVSLGGADVAYYRTVHGKRRLVPISGVIAPATCAGAGFSFEARITFEDLTTSVAEYTSPCPPVRR